MKTKILAATLTALLIAFIATPVFATVIEEVREAHPTLWASGGTMYDRTGGRDTHAYQYLSYTSPNGFSWGKWKVYSYEPATSYFWWVWIPYNLGNLDAVVSYQVNGAGQSFTKVVNQESYADTWVYLGGISGDNTGNTYLGNYCVGGYTCDPNYEVWWDNAMYQHP